MKHDLISTPAPGSSRSAGKRVVLLTLDFPPGTGGVQQFLFELSRRIGRRFTLTVVHPTGDPALFASEPFQLVSLAQDSHRPMSAGRDARSSFGARASAHVRLQRVLTKLRPNITFVGHAHPRLLLPAALSGGGRFIVLAHGNDFEAAQHRWHAKIFNRLLARAHLLVTNSHRNARRLQELGLPSPEILYPGTHPDRFSPPATTASGPPILLTVARLVPRKGIDTVLETLPVLLDSCPHLQYWIVGKGPERASLARQAQELGLMHEVRFMDEVSDSELPEIYRRATIFVLPARADFSAGSVEGFGIVYLEASASGLPVVAANSGGAAEAVIENETGLLVPENDPPALTQALSRLLKDAAMRQQMGRAGRRWVESEMNWDRAGRQMISIIERAL